MEAQKWRQLKRSLRLTGLPGKGMMSLLPEEAEKQTTPGRQNKDSRRQSTLPSIFALEKKGNKEENVKIEMETYKNRNYSEM